jgi:electron transfer flavoprotein beta subunit
MNLIVCVKQVFDPETPAASFKIDPEKKRAIPPKDKPMVISPFDESAVEAALKVKEAHAGSKVTVLSMGGESAKEVIKHSLAMGADEGVQLTDPSFDDSDSFATASIIAGAIKKMGQFDIIFCGRQDADWDAGQVGSGIAELLVIPSVTAIKKIDIKDGKAVVERVLPDGYEVVEVSLPVLVTVSNEIGTPRYATLKGIMAAGKKPVTKWKSSDVPAPAAKNKMLKLFIPVHEAKCEFVACETPEEAGAKLAVRLREAKLF